MRSLARRDHGRVELGRKLGKKSKDKVMIGQVLDRLTELGYLDDRKAAFGLARGMVELRANGPRAVEQKLRRRGFAPALIAEVLRELVEPAAPSALQRSLARQLRLAKANWWTTPEGRAKILRSLARRGFDPEAIIEAVDAAAHERRGKSCDD